GVEKIFPIAAADQPDAAGAGFADRPAGAVQAVEGFVGGHYRLPSVSAWVPYLGPVPGARVPTPPRSVPFDRAHAREGECSALRGRRVLPLLGRLLGPLGQVALAEIHPATARHLHR